MESNESSSITDDGNVESSKIDSSNNKRIKLEKEIEELKKTLQQLQKKLNVANIEESLSQSNANDVSDMSNKVTPIDILLELYRYGGLYCMKSDNDKIVFGLNSSAKEQHKNECAVQFIKKGKTIKISKWVMPMSIDIEQLQSEVQLKSQRDTLHFIRNCKQHTNCYESRLQQFEELKYFTDNLKNCNVQTNLGPTNIKFEIPENAIYDEDVKIQLKKSLKVFRSNDLRTAFDQIFDENNMQFTWERVEEVDDIFENNESSISLDEVSTYRRLPQEGIAGRASKRLKKVLKRQSHKKKKNNNSIIDLNQQDANVKEINKPTNSEAPLKVKSIKNKLMNQMTLDKFTNKSYFSRKEEKDLEIIKNKFNIKPSVIKVQKLNEKYINNKYTSTPIKSNIHNTTPFKVLPRIDLSRITLDNSYE